MKKCTLKHLKCKEKFCFLTYPYDPLPDLTSYVILSPDAHEILTKADAHRPLFLIDATWNLATKIQNFLEKKHPDLTYRSLPKNFHTAYPRRQTGCKDPNIGLASIEALYLAFCIQGKEDKTLLDHYYWKQQFLTQNGLA